MAGPITLDRRQVISLAGLMTVAPSWAGANISRQAPRWPTVDALLQNYVSAKKFAGIAAAVSYQGARAAFLVAGTLAYDSLVKVDENSLFRIYSVTKPVTGIAAMMLVEDGLIGLDQPVAEILPELRDLRVAIDPANSLASRPITRPITMRQLLTHSSGLSNWQPILGDTPITKAYRERGITPGNFVRQPGETWYTEQVQGLDAMITGIAEVPLIAEPGTVWNYSMGLDVMGAVIERASGMGLDAFMKARIFDPLDMPSTGFSVARKNAARLTTLYGNAPGGPQAIDRGANSIWLKPPTLLAGGGGLVSSARDFMRFAQMLLNDGSLDGVRVMKSETVKRAMSDLLPLGVQYPPTSGFGAGASVVMSGVKSDIGPPGTFSAVGACSTLFQVDPARSGAAVFFAQYMPGRTVPMPEALRFRAEFNDVINQDLQRQ
jgi:CubicO group peptidase (beta-lactamase class C family)